MKQRISVINKSNGKFTIETINGREHIVTLMMAIEGDSVMNELLYPNSIVSNALPQLEMLPAPDRHPNINGKPVSAFNPLAINAHNFGGFTRSPHLDGKRGMVDLVIDLEVANKLERGKKIVNKIKAGERIGVSTGLIADVSNEKGKVGKQKYNGIVNMIEFDHVAVLLDETPAGENTYTINHDGKLTQKRGMKMDEITLDLTDLAIGDRNKLSELTVNQLLAHVNHEITVDEAKAIVINAGLHINKIPEADIEEYLINKDDFETFKTAGETKIEETKVFILKNSKMEREQLDEMNAAQLDSLSKTVTPKNTYIAPDGKRKNNKLELLDDNILPEAG